MAFSKLAFNPVVLAYGQHSITAKKKDLQWLGERRSHTHSLKAAALLHCSSFQVRGFAIGSSLLQRNESFITVVSRSLRIIKKVVEIDILSLGSDAADTVLLAGLQ